MYEFFCKHKQNPSPKIHIDMTSDVNNINLHTSIFAYLSNFQPSLEFFKFPPPAQY